MKKILLTGLLCAGVLTSLSAVETSGKIKLSKSPVDTNFLSVENGGTKAAIDAYSDGVGIAVVGSSITVDNSKMNNSVFTDGVLAKNESVSLKEFLNNKNGASGESIEVIGGLVSLTTVIGNPCNDENSNTGNDIYIDENGTCLGLPIKTENKCYEDSIGTEFIFNGKNFLVVDDITIRDNLDRAETLCVSNVTDMSGLFYGSSFNQDISSWDVSNVVSMKYMFALTTSFNQNISNWNVSHVVNMNYMFGGASNFNQPLNNWDVSNVIDLAFMFSNATLFNQPLNNWNVSNVIDLDYMFIFASSFNQNLRSWNVNNALSFNGFRNGSALTSANSAQKTISPYTIF